jgi:hypothetical protein
MASIILVTIGGLAHVVTSILRLSEVIMSVVVSQHAISRFKQRTGDYTCDNETIAQVIKDKIQHYSKKARLKASYYSHYFRKYGRMNYLRGNKGIIYVVDTDGNVVTCLPQSANHMFEVK